MAYKAQLVVRASDRDGVEVVEGVKAMADRLGKTYSEMALELLSAALGSPVADTASTDDAPAEAAASPAPPQPAPAAETAEAAPAKKAEPAAPRATEAPAKKAAPAKVRKPSSGTTIDLKRPLSIVEALIAERDNDGDEAASRVLVDFYAIAGPADSFKLKQALQEKLGDEAYEALMEPVKETPEYRDYKDRALFGR
ncbi:hypothetical protein DL240_14155 [Lujinxingia litoralis]|uniref:Uncharacterized protein n=1 Tax=Lujinxingia litoralis TaxID=2211119 RepID=A0A328C7Z1_9DELT|nr:hypothetical protein [Lujinxingia litoralis]RAL21265.1 hypothetical protein DL240_14155 [Lujinxingia litoralis]